MTGIAAYVPDLMDRSRIEAVVDGVRFVVNPEELEEAAETLIVVDLARVGDLARLASVPGRVIGFGAHVDHELLDAASAAGCDVVLPRSKFFRDLATLMAGHESSTGEVP